MKKQKEVPALLSVLLLVLCIGSIFHSVHAVIHNSGDFHFVLMCISSALLGIAALAYCLGGYKKNNAPLFKTVCFFLAFTAIMGLAQTMANEEAFALMIIYVLLAVIGLIFLFVPNLGKAISYRLAALNLLLTVLLLVVLFQTGAVLEPIGSLFSIVKMVIFGIIVYAKYVDKDTRGTV